jgi:hypothetical protein
MNMKMEKLYSVSGAARYAHCSEATVRRAERAGIVRAQRDSSGRRLLTQTEADKLREHMQRHRTPF